jgi:beta-lactamase class D
MQKTIRLLFISSIALLLPLAVMAEDATLAALFNQHSIEGTIVISSLNSDQTFIHNKPRAQQKFSTASTFKILNSLISLEEKAIAGKEAVLKWDGHIHSFPDWNRDQTLESAFKVSCVWCFQELARRVGADTYRRYLRDTTYGELREPFSETSFWLDGSLQISAIEQVNFMKKVHRRTLPFSPPSYDALNQIMLVEQTPAFTLRAKTGWAMQENPQIGWYVGLIETPADVWAFATNIEVRTEKNLPLRQKLTREALHAKGIIQ